MSEKKKMSKGKKIMIWLGGIILIGSIIGHVPNSDTAQESVEDKVEEDDAGEKPKEEPEKEEDVADDEKVVEESLLYYQGYENRIAEIIKEFDGIIIDIRPNAYTKSYQQMEIVVDGNVWEYLSETDKIAFSEAAADSVEKALNGYSVIDFGSTVTFDILDENGYELAKRGAFSSKFKIKR